MNRINIIVFVKSDTSYWYKITFMYINNFSTTDNFLYIFNKKYDSYSLKSNVFMEDDNPNILTQKVVGKKGY